jgi:hypothetical protein
LPSYANIHALASVPGDAVAFNVPDANAVAVDSPVAHVIAAVGVPSVPAIVMVYDNVVAGLPAAAIVFTAVDIPGVPAAA